MECFRIKLGQMKADLADFGDKKISSENPQLFRTVRCQPGVRHRYTKAPLLFLPKEGEFFKIQIEFFLPDQHGKIVHFLAFPDSRFSVRDGIIYKCAVGPLTG